MKQDGILTQNLKFVTLTEEAREERIGSVIGRNKEIQETAEILSRRTRTTLSL